MARHLSRRHERQSCAGLRRQTQRIYTATDSLLPHARWRKQNRRVHFIASRRPNSSTGVAFQPLLPGEPRRMAICVCRHSIRHTHGHDQKSDTAICHNERVVASAPHKRWSGIGHQIDYGNRRKTNQALAGSQQGANTTAPLAYAATRPRPLRSPSNRRLSASPLAWYLWPGQSEHARASTIF